MSKPIIHPQNSLLYLLRQEFFRQCNQKKITKHGEKLIQFTHPKFKSFEEWLVGNGCAIPQSAVLGPDGKPMKAQA